MLCSIRRATTRWGTLRAIVRGRASGPARPGPAARRAGLSVAREERLAASGAGGLPVAGDQCRPVGCVPRDRGARLLNPDRGPGLVRLEDGDRLPGLHLVSLAGRDRAQASGDDGLHLHDGLVGLDLEEGLAPRDGLAHLRRASGATLIGDPVVARSGIFISKSIRAPSAIVRTSTAAQQLDSLEHRVADRQPAGDQKRPRARPCPGAGAGSIALAVERLTDGPQVTLLEIGSVVDLGHPQGDGLAERVGGDPGSAVKDQGKRDAVDESARVGRGPEPGSRRA